MSRSWNGANIGCRPGLPPGLRLEPVLGRAQPSGIAQAQVFVPDPLAAGQQRIGKLHRRHVEIPLDPLEPFQRVARRRLQAQHLDPAFILIALEGALQRRFGVQVIRQRNRTESNASRVPEPMEIMPRRRRIAHQHDIAVVPAFADHPGELHPDR